MRKGVLRLDSYTWWDRLKCEVKVFFGDACGKLLLVLGALSILGAVATIALLVSF